MIAPTAFFGLIAAMFRAMRPEEPPRPRPRRKSWETILDMGAQR